MNRQSYTLVTGDFVLTGGMDRANYALASFLARSGHPLNLVAHRVAPELAGLPGVNAHKVSRPLGSHFLGQWPLAWAGRRSAIVGARHGWRTIVNGANCHFQDVNWVHYVHAAYRPEISNFPVRRLKTAFEYKLNLRDERRALQAARVVICNSELTRRHVTELCGVPSNRTTTVYYGIDPVRFRPASELERAELRTRFKWPVDRPVFVFVGALGDRRKGFDTLFAAWSSLCKSCEWDGLLVVVGSGAEHALWQAKVDATELCDNVQFLGYRSDVDNILRAADVLVAPTRYEAYGLGVHEALCCGLPAFVSASAGVAERYPTELASLLLSDPNDDVDLAARLRSWRNDPARIRSQVQALCEKLRGNTWDDMSRRIVAAIEEHS
jgi:glycosyltransferase involved in cell wall biosynthesis